MLTSISRKVAAGSAAVALALFAAACTSGAGAQEEGGASALPPVLVPPSELVGKTFEITKEHPLVVNLDDPAEVEAWTGQVVDEAVAEFIPGLDDGSAQFNPGFEAVGSGTTEASVTSPDGETLEFTIRVP